jgi:hypothetical protein
MHLPTLPKTPLTALQYIRKRWVRGLAKEKDAEKGNYRKKKV